jgi:hypothetical protein
MSNPTPAPTPSRTRLGAAAGLLGAVAALTVLTGAGPVPSIFQLTGAVEDVRGSCDEAEHAADPSCVGTLTARGNDDGTGSTSSTSSTIEDGSSTTTPTAGGGQPAGADVRTVAAGEAGSVLVAVEGSGLRLLTASPNQGWQVVVERAVGREVEVSFRSGSRRIDLNLELEDGQLRTRVRTRDDATDTRTETTDGVVTTDGSSGPGSGSDDTVDDSDDDNSGPGSDDSVDDSDDNSGPGSGSDDTVDDNSGSGSGSDDTVDDNSGSGSGGSGSDDTVDDTSGHGSDDGPGHD